MRGLSFAEMGDNANSIRAFKKVIDDNKAAGSAVFRDEAEYYLALTYIRNRDFDFALDLLRNIAENQGHLYNKQVTVNLIRQVKLLKWR